MSTTHPFRIGQRVVLDGAIVTIVGFPAKRNALVRFGSGTRPAVIANRHDLRGLSGALHHARSVLSSVAAELDPGRDHFVGLAAEVLALADAADAAEQSVRLVRYTEAQAAHDWDRDHEQLPETD